MDKHHENMLRRIRLVCDIVQRHYEPGNYAKSYYKVWQQYVYPVYPCCYRTMLKYVNTPAGSRKTAASAAKHPTKIIYP